MKAKYKILKKLLCLSPVVTLPVLAAACGTDDLPPNGPQGKSAAFMPYYDVTLYNKSIMDPFKATKQQAYMLAFMNQDIYPNAKGDVPQGTLVTWAGLDPDSAAYHNKQGDGTKDMIDKSIDSIRKETDNKAGLGVSYGGANGIPPWLWWKGALMTAKNVPTGDDVGKLTKEVADNFDSIEKEYKFVRYDMDIEGAAVAWASGAGVQTSAKILVAALNEFHKDYPKVKVSFTLPVIDYGLTQNGDNYLKYIAKNYNGDFILNGMTMDFGDIGYKDFIGKDNADYLANVASVQSYEKQLKAALSAAGKTKTDADLYAHWIGITPMIGVNDYEKQILYYKDAQLLETWAKNKKISWLSFWSSSRDHPGTKKSGLYASYALNGGPYVDFAYTQLWNAYSVGS